jgi:hypothetical protein
MRRDVKALLDYAASQGCEARIGRSGHWKVYLDGRLVTTVGCTPSSKRSMKNSRAFLERRLREVRSAS